MKKSLLILFLLFHLSYILQSQDYVAFDEPIPSIIIGNRTFTNEDGIECTLNSKSEIEILGRGYNNNRGKYYFKNDNCSGFISFAWFAAGEGFKEQDKNVNKRIYEIKNAQAQKELEKERQQKKERDEIEKHICTYVTNEIDVFDKVKVVRTTSRFISQGLMLHLYSKGSKKKVVFWSSSDLGCTSPYKNNRSKVRVMLENEDVITFYHSGNLDCGAFELWGNVSNSELLRLKKSPIKAIKLSGTEYYDTIEDFEWPTFFIDQLKCFNPE